MLAVQPVDLRLERAERDLERAANKAAREYVGLFVVEAAVDDALLRAAKLVVSRLAEPTFLPLSSQNKGIWWDAGGSGTYGSFTRTRPWMETRACSSDDREGVHDSFLSPAQVPRMDKQTFPSSYKFLRE